MNQKPCNMSTCLRPKVCDPACYRHKNIMPGQTKWSRRSTGTTARCCGRCPARCPHDARGKNFVVEFAIEKMNVQAFHLLGSNARCVLPNDCHQVKIKSNQTCMPVGSPFGRRWSSETYLICTTLYKHQEPPQTHNVDHFQCLQKWTKSSVRCIQSAVSCASICHSSICRFLVFG